MDTRATSANDTLSQCPSWCTSDERCTDGHPHDRVLIHTGDKRIVTVGEFQQTYEIQVRRYDWYDGGHEVMIQLDDQPISAADANALGMALIAAALAVEGDTRA